ncbi:MAG: STT3 domain-containing protein [Aquificaceae bacterium]
MKGDNRLYSFYFITLFVVLLAFGLYLRLSKFEIWEKNKDAFFYNGEPIYSEFDSMYFARLAEDIKSGSFKVGEVDSLRFFPDNHLKPEDFGLDRKYDFQHKYSIAGSLISYLLAYLSMLSGKSVAWISYYLVPLLSISPAIPIFLYFYNAGLPISALLGSLVGITSYIYVVRTDIMRLDTDLLNLTFPFFIAFFLYKYFESEKKLLWISLSSITLLLYYLWYGHSNINFALILPVFLLYLIRYKSLSKKDILYMAILILPQIWYIYTGPYYVYLQIATLIFGKVHDVSGIFKDFPNVFISISELQKYSFKAVLQSTNSVEAFSFMGLLGAFLVFILNLKRMIFSLPVFGIGLLSFFGGNRFVMYLGPFIGVGLGYLVHLFFEKLFPKLGLYTEKNKQIAMSTLVGSFLFVFTLMVQNKALSLLGSSPIITSEEVEVMDWIRENTPPNSVIYTWWDTGYAFELYSKRAVLHDGGSQSTPKTYFVAASFTTGDFREAWNITSFLSNYGLVGMASLLQKEGVKGEELVRRVREGFYSKDIKVPIYWVFTRDMLFKSGWITYFGSYNFKDKKGVSKNIYGLSCKVVNEKTFECLGNTKIDLDRGIIIDKAKTTRLKALYFIDEKAPKTIEYNKDGPSILLIQKRGSINIYIMDAGLDNTLLFKMYVLRQYDPNYFELIRDRFPIAVIYKAKSSITN